MAATKKTKTASEILCSLIGHADITVALSEAIEALQWHEASAKHETDDSDRA